MPIENIFRITPKRMYVFIILIAINLGMVLSAFDSDAIFSPSGKE